MFFTVDELVQFFSLLKYGACIVTHKAFEKNDSPKETTNITQSAGLSETRRLEQFDRVWCYEQRPSTSIPSLVQREDLSDELELKLLPK